MTKGETMYPKRLDVYQCRNCGYGTTSVHMRNVRCPQCGLENTYRTINKHVALDTAFDSAKETEK